MKRLLLSILACTILACPGLFTQVKNASASPFSSGSTSFGDESASLSSGAGQHAPVTLNAIWSDAQAHPGDQRTLAVIATIPPGYHLNPDKAHLPADPGFNAIPTKLTARVTDGKSLILGKVQYPSPEMHYDTTASAPLVVFQGKIVMYLPVVVRADTRPGKFDITITLNYQMCNDQNCFPPVTVSKTVTLYVVPLSQSLAVHSSSPGTQKLFAHFDPTVFPAMAKGNHAAPAQAAGMSKLHDDFFGHSFTLDPNKPFEFALILLIVFVIGILLNFTPCVLPVVPLKIMALHEHATSPAGRIRNGLIFSAGIVATFLLLGALVAGLIAGVTQFQWGEIFAYPAVSIALAAIIIAMALSMFGLYTIRLPKAFYMFNPSYDTALGNFGLGILAALLSTPCTGPMMGTAIAWSVKQSAAVSLSTFGIMGVGMALPYLLLTLKPGWLKLLPRTGPGSELIKQTMGILLVAVAIFFLGPIMPSALRWWLIAAIIVAAMVWLLFRTFAITVRSDIRAEVILVAAFFMVTAGFVAWELTRPGIHWQPFSQKAFATARAEGKTILVEYTADWCSNCKLLETTAYRNPRLKALFDQPGYVAFRVDLTSEDNKVGWARLRAISSSGGIPVAVVYRSGGNKNRQVFSGLFTSHRLLTALHGSDEP